jgi:hypothetical protein
MSSTTVGARGFRNFARAAGIACLSLTIVACGGGGGDSAAPSADAIEACLNGAGVAAESLPDTEGIEAIGAAAPDGDLIVIINLPEEFASNPDVPGMVSRRIKREFRKLGRGGVWTSSTVNGGSTYVGVLGVKGTGGGLASASTEILARQCATKAQRAAKAQGTSTGTEA